MIRRLIHALTWWFPASVPPAARARVLAAMEGDPQSPVSSSQGEGSDETGHTLTPRLASERSGRETSAGGDRISPPAGNHPDVFATETLLSWGEPS